MKFAVIFAEKSIPNTAPPAKADAVFTNILRAIIDSFHVE